MSSATGAHVPGHRQKQARYGLSLRRWKVRMAMFTLIKCKLCVLPKYLKRSRDSGTSIICAIICGTSTSTSTSSRTTPKPIVWGNIMKFYHSVFGLHTGTYGQMACGDPLTYIWMWLAIHFLGSKFGRPLCTFQAGNERRIRIMKSKKNGDACAKFLADVLFTNEELASGIATVTHRWTNNTLKRFPMDEDILDKTKSTDVGIS